MRDDEAATGAAPAAQSAWRRRLASVPRGIWALVVAPVIPLVVAALMTHWLDGGDAPAPARPPAATATPAPTWDLTGAGYTEQMVLGDFLEGDAAARERLRTLLGCEGWVFTVRLKIAGAGDGRPQLRWSLRQDRGLEQPWDVPAALDGIRTVPVSSGVASKRVWIAVPPQRETWRVQFALYAAPADIPDDAADTLTVKDRVDSIPLPPGEGSGPCALEGS
jgi:hypothetical protein